MTFARRAASLLLAACVMLAGSCVTRGPLLESSSRVVELDATPFFPQARNECGPAALATVLGASLVAVTPEELEKRVYLPGRRGSLQIEMQAAPRAYRPALLPHRAGAVGHRPGTGSAAARARAAQLWPALLAALALRGSRRLRRTEGSPGAALGHEAPPGDVGCTFHARLGQRRPLGAGDATARRSARMRRTSAVTWNRPLPSKARHPPKMRGAPSTPRRTTGLMMRWR